MNYTPEPQPVDADGNLIPTPPYRGPEPADAGTPAGTPSAVAAALGNWWDDPTDTRDYLDVVLDAVTAEHRALAEWLLAEQAWHCVREAQRQFEVGSARLAETVRRVHEAADSTTPETERAYR